MRASRCRSGSVHDSGDRRIDHRPVDIAAHRVLLELLDALPGLAFDSGLSGAHKAIVEDIRCREWLSVCWWERTLSVSGAAYQGAFQNPLADPYLLGIAAGAGLGATIAIANTWRRTGSLDPVPLAAFSGALLSVAVSYAAGHLGGRSTVSADPCGHSRRQLPHRLVQTYVLQANSDAFREIFAWILGRIATSGWSEPALMFALLPSVRRGRPALPQSAQRARCR